MKSAYQQKLDTGVEPLLLRVGEDMRELVQSMRATTPKHYRQLVVTWADRHQQLATLVLDELATFLVDLTRAAEQRKPRTTQCKACGGKGATTEET